MVAFTTETYTIRETERHAPITVTLQTPLSQTAAVAYATFQDTASAGSDYLTATGTLTFTPGTTWLTFTVTIINDTLAEGDERLTLLLRDPVNSTLGLYQTAKLIIADDDGERNKIYLPVVLQNTG